MQTKQLIRRGLLATAALTALMLFLGLQSRPRTLIQSARRLATFDAVLSTRCVWLSDHTGVYMRYRADDSGFELARLDVDTGQVTPLDALNRKYETRMRWREDPRVRSFVSSGRNYRQVPTMSASPDGKWLVFCFWPTPMRDRNARCRYLATDLEGTREVWWDSQLRMPREPYWLQDGHRWLEPIRQAPPNYGLTSLMVHDLERPTQDRLIPVPAAARNLEFVGITQKDRAWGAPNHLHGTMQWSFDSRISISNEDHFIPGLSAENDSTTVHHYNFQLPEGTHYYTSTLSPQGDRLAWQIKLRYSSWLDHLQHRFTPLEPIHSEPRIGIWACDLDGSHWTEVGYNVTSDKEMQLVDQVQWMPGGKAISFLYRDGIYIVPAP